MRTTFVLRSLQHYLGRSPFFCSEPNPPSISSGLTLLLLQLIAPFCSLLLGFSGPAFWPTDSFRPLSSSISFLEI